MFASTNSRDAETVTTAGSSTAASCASQGGLRVPIHLHYQPILNPSAIRLRLSGYNPEKSASFFASY